jgi:ankyrin repeat protein
MFGLFGKSKKIKIFFRACEDDDVSAVSSSLEEGMDIEVVTKQGATGLMMAVIGGAYSVVSLLLEKSANIDAVDRNKTSVLMHAAKNDNSEIVKLLVASGADVNCIDAEGRTALMYALANKRNDSAIILIEHGSDVHHRSTKGLTPLYFAVGNAIATENIAFRLIEMNVDVNAKTVDGDCILGAACTSHASMQLVKTLVDNGADVNSKDVANSSSVLNEAIEHTSLDIVNLLISKGADVNFVRANTGLTPLFDAVHRGSSAIVLSLLKSGANPNIQGTGILEYDNEVLSGVTCLMSAAACGHISIMKALLEYGADLNETNSFGWTALDVAIVFANQASVDFLKARGCKRICEGYGAGGNSRLIISARES